MVKITMVPGRRYYRKSDRITTLDPDRLIKAFMAVESGLVQYTRKLCWLDEIKCADLAWAGQQLLDMGALPRKHVVNFETGQIVSKSKPKTGGSADDVGTVDARKPSPMENVKPPKRPKLDVLSQSTTIISARRKRAQVCVDTQTQAPRYDTRAQCCNRQDLTIAPVQVLDLSATAGSEKSSQISIDQDMARLDNIVAGPFTLVFLASLNKRMVVQ